MAKKQKSFADKAAGGKSSESVYVKHIKSIQSEQTGRWRFNEQMVRMDKGEQLDAALKRMDEAANLVDIDLTEFVGSDKEKNQEALNPKNLENNSEPSDKNPAEQVGLSEEE